jgi:hypothetical protein
MKYQQGISERGIITDWHGKIPKGMSKRHQEGRLGRVLEVSEKMDCQEPDRRECQEGE